MRRMTSLEKLELGNTKVTDAGLDELKGLPNLQSVSLRTTQVTDVGISNFQEAMPNCVINR